jgi:hypothetical protein
MKLSSSILCPICHTKKGRTFNHAKCGKILQQQYNVKTKAKKVARTDMENYMVVVDRMPG